MNGQKDMLEPKDICKTARKVAGIKQKEMAPLLGVGVTTLWRWENGVHDPDAAYMMMCELILRLKQDGDGLELEVKPCLESIDVEKNSPKSCLLALWSLCDRKGKRYIVEEMAGTDKTLEDTPSGERGEAAVDATLSLLGDFEKSIRERVLKLAPDVQAQYMAALTDIAGGVGKLRLAREYERSKKESIEESGEGLSE